MNIENQYNKVVKQNRSLQQELRETRKVLRDIKEDKAYNYNSFKEMVEAIQKKASDIL